LILELSRIYVVRPFAKDSQGAHCFHRPGFQLQPSSGVDPRPVSRMNTSEP
jgi:hypothetical protein